MMTDPVFSIDLVLFHCWRIVYVLYQKSDIVYLTYRILNGRGEWQFGVSSVILAGAPLGTYNTFVSS